MPPVFLAASWRLAAECWVQRENFRRKPVMSETQTAPVARIVANDPRADSGQREIAVTADSIAIDRCVAGVRMRLSLPTRSFRGVALALQQGARGLFYRVALVHADPDLDVALAEADNERDAARDWLAWAKFFRLPRLTRVVKGRRRRGREPVRRDQGRRGSAAPARLAAESAALRHFGAPQGGHERPRPAGPSRRARNRLLRMSRC